VANGKQGNAEDYVLHSGTILEIAPRANLDDSAAPLAKELSSLLLIILILLLLLILGGILRRYVPLRKIMRRIRIRSGRKNGAASPQAG
jgi:hypothetical protein